jgi:hypothetical protein
MDSVRYLNPNLISQSVINPIFQKGKVEEESTGKEKKVMDIVVHYIGTIMYHWRDRECIVAPYNFE